MFRFQMHDLAITCNSRAPLVNNGHLVRILAVIGPMPELELQFGYLIERVDGQPFALASWTSSQTPVFGTVEIFAEYSQLRPLNDGLQEAHVDVTKEASA